MMGFVNAHTHLYSGLAPFDLPYPSPPPATFVDVLARFWWRLDRALDAPILRAAARYYVADALLHGTCALVDHHESPNLIEGSLDILADACQELGMRAVLCYGATERNGSRLEAERGLAECRRFIRDNRRPLVRGLIGLHASFTVSDETIREAGDLCREMQVPLHLHVAEDRCDVEDARRRGYKGVLARLESLHALPAGSILAHGVHLTREETMRVRARGCWIVQNPRSNQQNRVGYPAALDAADRVALGTDGFPSDMRGEREAGVEIARTHGETDGVIDERLRAGERLVARCFDANSEDDTGDLRARDAHGLVIGGRVAVERGRLMTGNWDEIREEAATQAKRLAARMGNLGDGG
jgi:cytosine/adenosine deaminase-related metal-dependent hydrolase